MRPEAAERRLSEVAGRIRQVRANAVKFSILEHKAVTLSGERA
jgi:hypothetical protein